MTPNKRDIKAYVRFDGTGRVIPGSLVLRREKPKTGNWKEIQAYECCDTFRPLLQMTLFYGEDLSMCYSGAVSGTYYIDITTNNMLPVIYLDALGTTLAPDGYYNSSNSGTGPFIYVDLGVSYITNCA
jgi:hypothetical protein